MAKEKFDGVVEAVRYGQDGQIEWVRVYERRGVTYSDHILLDRETLLERLKAGERFVAGQRVPYKASTFETSNNLRVIQQNRVEIVVAGDEHTDQDDLQGVPII